VLQVVNTQCVIRENLKGNKNMERLTKECLQEWTIER